MGLLTGKTELIIWRDVIRHAEKRCSIVLDEELETYLISLLIRYTNKPEVTKQIIATAFLDALNVHSLQQIAERNVSLQHVGDQCLLFAGLFPRIAEKKQVKLSYFVDIGRSAYAEVSTTAHDLFWSLAYQFVMLTDILQSIRPYSDLLPMEAYEQWNDIGSQRALRLLREYTESFPCRFIKDIKQ